VDPLQISKNIFKEHAMTRSGILPALCILPALFLAGPVSAQDADCSFWTSDEETAWTDVASADIEACIAAGKDVNDKSGDGHPVVSAALYSNLSTFRSLLEAGGDPEANDTRNSVGFAIMDNPNKDSSDRLQLLIDAGVVFTSERLDELLAGAAISGSIETTIMLVALGGDPLARPYGQTIMHFAVRQKDMSADYVKHLINIDVPVDGRARRTGIVGEEGQTALIIAASMKNLAVTQALLENGADSEAQTRLLVTPLHAAIAAESVENLDRYFIVEELIEAGADVNSRLGHGNMPLHVLLSIPDAGDRDAIAQSLVEAGADLTAKNQNSNTPLHLAVQLESAELINLFLDSGVDVNIPNDTGKTAWDYAAKMVTDEGIDPELVHAYWRIYDASF
jgi:ankyrin repeat protein